MNSKDLRLGVVAAAAALWALWPSWLDPRVVPANFGDLFTFHQPLRHMVTEALQTGRLPFWNPYTFSGIPLLANPQAVTFYPVSTLGYVLPLTLAFSWDFLLHLLWAMLGTALLARRGGLPAAAAWTAALLYALSPFLIFRVTEGIPTLLAALAWTPWCWLAWDSGRAGWLGVVWALQLLSGHGQFLVVNAAGMGLAALLLSKRLPRLLGLAREGAWALALTLVQWAPTRQFLALSVRRSWPRAFSLGYSLDWASLGSLLSPTGAGEPYAGTFAGPPSVFFETRALSVGLVGLALAALGLSLKKRRALPLALLAVGVALALGQNSPLYRLLLPVLAALRTPSRWLLLSLWALVLSAAAGAAALARRRDGRRLAAAVFALALLELGARDARFLGSERADDRLRASAAFAAHFADEPRRLLTSPDLANPNKTALYHALNVNGYDAFYLDGYPQYAARSEGGPAADASRTYLNRIGTPETDRLAVGFRIGADGRLQTTATGLPLAYFADRDERPLGPAPALERPRPELWEVRGFWPAAARRLILSQPLFPGWRAWLDGRRVDLRSWDGLLQAVERPAGGERRFAVAARFEPSGWPLLALATALAWLAWFARMARA